MQSNKLHVTTILMTTSCGICMSELTDNKTKLKCGHIYHRLCIAAWYQQMAKDNRYTSHSKESLVAPRCPYCRQPGGYLDLLPGEDIIMGVHTSLYDAYLRKQEATKLRKATQTNKSKCTAVTKRGTQCSRSATTGQYCGTHHNNVHDH